MSGTTAFVRYKQLALSSTRSRVAKLENEIYGVAATARLRRGEASPIGGAAALRSAIIKRFAISTHEAILLIA